MKEIEIKILASFFPKTDGEYTASEIEKKSRYSHERVHTTLRNLTKKEYITKKKFGRSHVFKINLKKDLLIPFLYFQEKRKEEFSSLLKISEKKMLEEFIKKISSPNLISVIIFGSYAKGEIRKDSDIDILCVTRKNYDIEEIALSLRHKYGKKIGVVVIPVKDFPNIEKDNLVFFLDLREFGVVFYGREEYYRLVYGGGYE